LNKEKLFLSRSTWEKKKKKEKKKARACLMSARLHKCG